MPENEPYSVTFNINVAYHCALHGGQFTLCGIRAIDIAWDDPYTWHNKETSSSISGSLPKCPACLASEDLPLHLLGDVP